MNVALVHKRYSTNGGTERYVVSLAEALLKRGHYVHFFGYQWEKEREGIEYHNVPTLGGFSLLKVISYAYMVHSLIFKKELKEYDIIHGFGKTVRQDIYRAGGGCHKEWLNVKCAEIPLAPLRWLSQLLTSLNPLHIATLWIERRQFTPGNYLKIVANSNLAKEQIIQHYQVPPDDILVIHNGVDLEKFSPENRLTYRSQIREEFGIAQDDLVLLFVGTGFRRKGLRYAIQALGHLQAEERIGRLKLLVVGSGSQRKYKKFAKSLGLEDRVIFAGLQREVEAFYGASDLFVFPTLYDPFGSVCLEAMASGIPVITSRLNGAAELIIHQLNGLVLQDPTDDREIAEAIATLMDGNVRGQMGVEALALAQQYSIEANLEKTLDLYEQVNRIKRSQT